MAGNGEATPGNEGGRCRSTVTVRWTLLHSGVCAAQRCPGLSSRPSGPTAHFRAWSLRDRRPLPALGFLLRTAAAIIPGGRQGISVARNVILSIRASPGAARKSGCTQQSDQSTGSHHQPAGKESTMLAFTNAQRMAGSKTIVVSLQTTSVETRRDLPRPGGSPRRLPRIGGTQQGRLELLRLLPRVADADGTRPGKAIRVGGTSFLL